MAFADMISELKGTVPKIPIDVCPTYVNRAWKKVRENNLWSFQLFEGQWVAPALITGTGSATATQGSSIVTLDAAAIANLDALLATQPYSFITQRQFRIGYSGLYNIWGWDDTTGSLSLDRPWGEVSIQSSGYMIYQSYYIPNQNAGANPEYLKDFKSWISVRNIQNFIDLYTDRMTRAQLDERDPQRLSYTFPTDVVPYSKNTNPNSGTNGFFMFELWGAPLANYVYQLFGVRNGLDLVNDDDSLPEEVGEDCVIAYAKSLAYEWAEANKDMTPRANGPDYKFLIGKTLAEYKELLREYRRTDREKVDNWFSVRRLSTGVGGMPYYNTISGNANPGGMA